MFNIYKVKIICFFSTLCYSKNGDYMYITIDNKNIKLKKVNSFKEKFFGLMGKTNIDYALLFRCNGIHTFFMKEDIDIILTDKNYKILFLYKNLKKNRIILPKKSVYYTIELPFNSIKRIRIGDVIPIHK